MSWSIEILPARSKRNTNVRADTYNIYSLIRDSANKRPMTKCRSVIIASLLDQTLGALSSEISGSGL